MKLNKFFIVFLSCAAWVAGWNNAEGSASCENSELRHSAMPNLRAQTAYYQNYEVDRSNKGKLADLKAYYDQMNIPPNGDAILGRVAEVTSLILDPNEYREIPIDGRGRLYTSYWGALGRAALAVYMSDGKCAGVDLMIAASDFLFSRQNSYFFRVDDGSRRILPGWAAHTQDGFYNEIMTNGQVLLPMLDLMLVAKEDKWVRARIGDNRYENWLEQMDAILLQFDETYVIEPLNSYFVEPFNPSQVEAWNHMSVYGAALVKYHALTKSKRAKRIADSLVRFYHTITLKNLNGTVSWAYMPRPGNLGGVGEDVWKAVISIELPLAAYQHGFDVSRSDLLAISRILSRNIFLADGRIDRSISPGFYIPLDEMPSSLISMIAAWYRFSCLSPEVTPLIKNYFAKRPGKLSEGYLKSSRAAILGAAIWRLIEEKGCTDGLYNPR